MIEKIKTLQEVSAELNEEIGQLKKFNIANGYYQANLKNIELIDSKVRAKLSFKGDEQPISFGYFKSKKGYNSKYKNSKDYANHYGEYIAYIILKQLGKESCKVDMGEMEIKSLYTGEIINIEGILSHYQLTQQEMFKPVNIIIENYRIIHPKKYKKMTEEGKSNSKQNYANVEIILEALEDFYTRNGQKHKLPEMRKKFFDMCIFDIKFANRDRNDENFGLKINQETEEIEFYPMFDNEQILGMQENKTDVLGYLSDERKYTKFKNKELTSYVGIPGKINKINSRELLMYLLKKYHDETMDSLNDINRYKLDNLEELMNYCPNLSREHKELAKRIFKERELEIEDTVKKFEEEQEIRTKVEDNGIER